MELKKIDFTKDHFTANGREYLIRNTLTLERFIQYEKLQNHYAFGLSFSQIVGRLEQSINYANAGKGVEAWNVIFNLRDGIASRLEDRKHPALLLCSLFIITPDEDLTTWVEADQQRKFEDWNKEGIDIYDFFTLASNFTKDFTKIFSEISQSISQLQRMGAKFNSTEK